MSRPLVIVLVAALAAAPAHAHHPASRTIVPILDPLDARLTGVTVQLHHTLADQLVVENRTGRVLEVLDDDGTAFIRLGPAGAEENLGQRWTRVADVPAWGWYDRRLRAATDDVPLGGEHARWTVPLCLDGVPLALTGRFEPVRSGAFVARMTSPAEPLPGVRVSLIAGRVPALYVENSGRRPIVVMGRDGEPFLRIGPDGTSANVRSATWLASGKAAVTPAATRAPAPGEPLWRRVSALPRFAWVELRAAHSSDAPTSSGPAAVVRTWRVPIDRGRERADVAGVVEWKPGGSP